MIQEQLKNLFHTIDGPLKKIFVLTGAGISAESGIKTFRDSNGLWENHAIEEVASPEGFYKNPALVHQFYNLRRKQLKEVQPNNAHTKLAFIENNYPFDEFILATQNVDNLHERAGSKNIYHVHGELIKLRNLKNDKSFVYEEDVSKEDFLNFRPDIVWFGEQVKYMDELWKKVQETQLFICIGTSATVYPVAGLIELAIGNNIPSIEINPFKTNFRFGVHLEMPASQGVEFLLNYLTPFL